jgi:hypothetical protein
MQLSKSVLLSKERNITLKLRADATNLLNSPIWNTPNLTINSTGFNQITSAGGNRAVAIGMRIEF